MSEKLHANMIHTPSAVAPPTQQQLIEQLNRYGIIGFIIDYIDCASLVKSYLCNMLNFHRIPFSHRSLSNIELDYIFAFDRSHIRTLCTPSGIYSSYTSQVRQNAL